MCKKIGYGTRNMDELGRICLPVELRNDLGITTGAAIKLTQEEDGRVFLEKAYPQCNLCSSTKNLHMKYDASRIFAEPFYICQKCLDSLVDIEQLKASEAKL